MDELTVRVEAHPSVAQADRGALGQRLGGRVKDRIGVTATVEVLAPDSLQRSLGKAVRISDRRHR